MIGFKVVSGGLKRVDGFGEIKSAFADGRKVIYSLKQWAERPKGCGPLAVFKTLEHAQNFAIFHHSIYKCEYTQSAEAGLYTPTHRRWASDCPKGTVFANKVKLLKLIE